jgi:polysaccharide biosynthesis/export protein VpsN
MKMLFDRFASSLALIVLLSVGFAAAGCGGGERYKFVDPNLEGGQVGSDGNGGETGGVGPVGPTPDMLRTGDRIMIVFSGNPNAPQLPHSEQIREDGYITPPLLGTNILAAGKTIGRLQTELQERYVPAFFSTVTITVRSEERYFSVGGQVNRPGQILYRSDMTVLKAIQSAGDFTDFANRRRVLLTRKDGTLMEVDCRRALRDTRYDPPVYPGDIIHVQQRGF